jgi:transcription antitermination factor NusA-like protein
MPRDVLKFANKLKGLCEGISQKARTPLLPSRMTVEVMKELLDERIIENAGLQ